MGSQHAHANTLWLLYDAEWADDTRFAGAAKRRENIAALDEGIAAWSAPQDAGQAAALQAARVHAYRVNTMADLFTDPGLNYRRTWRVRRHPVIDDQAYYFPGFDLSETPGDVPGPAPLLGHDNAIVFREFLGLTENEYETHVANGVI